MKNENYRAIMELPVSKERAFDAVANHISGWWGKDLKGSSSHLNDVFTIHFGKTFGKFRVSEMVPAKKIVWDCVDNYLDIFNDKTQWRGTKLVWKFKDVDGGSLLSMTHIGLTPAIECYADCLKGWDFFVKDSLRKFLVDGKGMPGVGIRANIRVDGRLYEGTMYAKEDQLPEFSEGLIWGDIKSREGERIVSFYSVNSMNNPFDPQKMRGSYYFVIENTPVRDGVSVLTDLQKAIN